MSRCLDCSVAVVGVVVGFQGDPHVDESSEAYIFFMIVDRTRYILRTIIAQSFLGGTGYIL